MAGPYKGSPSKPVEQTKSPKWNTRNEEGKVKVAHYYGERELWLSDDTVNYTSKSMIKVKLVSPETGILARTPSWLSFFG